MSDGMTAIDCVNCIHDEKCGLHFPAFNYECFENKGNKINYFKSRLPSKPPQTKEELLALIDLAREMLAYVNEQWDEGIAVIKDKHG